MRRIAFWLMIGFVFTAPWEVAIKFDAIGRVSRLFGLLAATVWAVSVVVRGRVRPPDAYIKTYFAFVLWNGFTLYWSVDPSSTFKGFITYVQIFGMALMMWDLVERERHVELALQAFVAGAYISAISVIVNFVTAPPTKYPEYQRIKALGFEVDGIALMVALAVPVAWYLATKPTSSIRLPVLTVFNFIFVPIGAFAVILTGTRGAALASVPTVVFIFWTLRSASPARRYIASAMIVVGVLAVLFVAPSGPLDRIAGSVSDVTGGDDLSGRRDLWSEAIITFFENPIGGIGLDSNRASSQFGKEVHNTPLSVLVETGMVGFVLLGATSLLVLLRAWERTGWEAWFWRSQLAVIAIGALSLSLENRKAVWIFFTLCVTGTAAMRADRAAYGRELVGSISPAGQSAPGGDRT